MIASIKKSKAALTNPKLWVLFFLYVIVAGYAIGHHELWGDEIHSWNIARASSSFSDLINNARYEGHPPVWYIILWSISKCTHNLAYVQVVQLFIAGSVVFLILFYSPFPTLTKILIPFGYYLLFALTIYVAQVFISKWWLKKYHFGPVEWVWRQLSYAKRLPNRKNGFN